MALVDLCRMVLLESCLELRLAFMRLLVLTV